MFAKLRIGLRALFRSRQKDEAIPDLATVPVENPVMIEGPLELVDGCWLLRISLQAGGKELVAYTRGIGEIRGEILEIRLPGKLVENLGLKVGQHLWVQNKGGRFSFEWEREDAPARSS